MNNNVNNKGKIDINLQNNNSINNQINSNNLGKSGFIGPNNSNSYNNFMYGINNNIENNNSNNNNNINNEDENSESDNGDEEEFGNNVEDEF